MHPLPELREAARQLGSLRAKCEKAGEKLRPGSAQKTLNARRIEALQVALALIEREMGQVAEGAEAP